MAFNDGDGDKGGLVFDNDFHIILPVPFSSTMYMLIGFLCLSNGQLIGGLAG